jgi:hypothetical protein
MAEVPAPAETDPSTDEPRESDASEAARTSEVPSIPSFGTQLTATGLRRPSSGGPTLRTLAGIALVSVVVLVVVVKVLPSDPPASALADSPAADVISPSDAPPMGGELSASSAPVTAEPADEPVRPLPKPTAEPSVEPSASAAPPTQRPTSRPSSQASPPPPASAPPPPPPPNPLDMELK